MCSVGSNVNETARILFLGWTNQIEIIIGSLASLDVGYKVNVLWLPPIATSSLSKLKDLWFSFGGIRDFSLQLSWFFYFAFCQYLLQGAIRAGMKNLKGETHRCHSILELKGNSLWSSGLKWKGSLSKCQDAGLRKPAPEFPQTTETHAEHSVLLPWGKTLYVGGRSSTND